MKKAGVVMAWVAALLVIYVIAFGLTLGDIKVQGFFAKKRANVARQVFKETQSFNEGMEQQLLKLLLERSEKKSAGDTEGVAALDFTIQHRYATYNEANIGSPKLRAMLEEVKYGTSTTQY